jgi:uncharacterized phage protein gp47/JayE
MNAHAPGTCQCCAAPPAGEIYNRPGLAKLAYRIGTFTSFRKAMLQSIARDPGMPRLTTRQSDDFSIMLMELWAAVGDVLTFYQERIVNEAFLRTATQRDSVLRLARMLDYRLRAGLAAEAPVVFTADDNKSVRIPIGLRMMTIPEQDQVPQIFETIEAIVADAKLNEVRIHPLPTSVNPFARGTTSAVVIAGPEKLGATEKVLFFDRRGLEEKALTKIETIDDARVVTWAPPVQSIGFDPRATAASRYTRTLRFFGLSAPTTQYTLDTTVNPPVWHSNAVTGFNVSGTDLPLDAKYDDLNVGARLLLRFNEGGKAPIETAVVTAKRESTETLGILSDTVTKVTVQRVLRAEAPAVLSGILPSVFARGLEGAPIVYGLAWAYIELPKDGDDVTSPLAVVARAPGHDLVARSRSGSVIHMVDPLTSFPVWEDLGGIVTSAPAVASWGAMRLDVFARGLDGAMWHKWFDGAWHNWESLGGRLTSAPAAVSRDTNRIDIVARGTDNALWHRWWNGASWHGWTPLEGADTTGTPAIASTGVNRLDLFARTPEGALRHRAWNGTQWLPWESLDADIASDPGTAASGANIAIFAVARDGTLTRANWNGTTGTLDTWTPQTGGFEDINDRRGATLYQLDTEDIAFREYAYARRITGGSVAVPLAKLNAIDKRRVIELSDGSGAAPQQATVTGSATFAAVALGVDDHLQINFTPDLVIPLDATTSILRGNVAEATQGETVHDEILGDGDATVPFQKFALRKKPLTYINSPDSLMGKSSLRILVSGELWTEVDTLYGQPGNARVYVTRQLDDGTTIVQFGDGVTGARMASGRGNVVATYRIGVGVAAVIAEQLSILLDQPPGLKSALNRMPAEGGADAETLTNARTAAPTTVKTFGRAVSLLDFELIATGTHGVAKSNTTWVWSGLEKAIYLTVAGANGTTFSDQGLKDIASALATVRDPGNPLLIGNFVRVPVVLTINVAVDDTHVRDTVSNAVRDALRDYFAFTNLAFAQPIHLSVLSALVQSVTGVLSVDIDKLHFKRFQSWSAAQLAVRGATADPAQMHLRIFAARPRPTGATVDPIIAATFGASAPEVIPAEQAVIENEAADLTLNVTGGLV